MNLLLLLMLLTSNLKPEESHLNPIQKGKATYYADVFYGRRTTSGERVKKEFFTAAHRSLPFGTMVEVTNLSNQRSVVVRINDRGPFTKGFIIDLTQAGAKALGMMGKGIANVKVRVLGAKERKLLAEAPSILTGSSAPFSAGAENQN